MFFVAPLFSDHKRIRRHRSVRRCDNDHENEDCPSARIPNIPHA